MGQLGSVLTEKGLWTFRFAAIRFPSPTSHCYNAESAFPQQGNHFMGRRHISSQDLLKRPNRPRISGKIEIYRELVWELGELLVQKGLVKWNGVS
jgi:hypothetical protein